MYCKCTINYYGEPVECKHDIIVFITTETIVKAFRKHQKNITSSDLHYNNNH